MENLIGIQQKNAATTDYLSHLIHLIPYVTYVILDSSKSINLVVVRNDSKEVEALKNIFTTFFVKGDKVIFLGAVNNDLWVIRFENEDNLVNLYVGNDVGHSKIFRFKL